MKELWVRTFRLFREHPVLGAPYLVGQLLAICLWRIRGVAERSIFHGFSTGHSVLGGDVTSPTLDHDNLAKASLAYAPIGLATIFVIVCLFVIVIIVTSVMVASIDHEQEPDARGALALVATKWVGIMLFSLKFLFAYGVFGAGFTFLSIYLLDRVHRPEISRSAIYLPLMVLLEAGCVTWALTPAMIRLLRFEKTGVVSIDARFQGVLIAVLATEGGMALGLIAQRLESGLTIESGWRIITLSALNSLCANSPDVLLFIALGLLASEGVGDARSFAAESGVSLGERLSDWVRRARGGRGGSF
jgi:hypothetical protein